MTLCGLTGLTISSVLNHDLAAIDDVDARSGVIGADTVKVVDTFGVRGRISADVVDGIRIRVDGMNLYASDLDVIGFIGLGEGEARSLRAGRP